MFIYRQLCNELKNVPKKKVGSFSFFVVIVCFSQKLRLKPLMVGEKNILCMNFRWMRGRTWEKKEELEVEVKSQRNIKNSNYHEIKMRL